MSKSQVQGVMERTLNPVPTIKLNPKKINRAEIPQHKRTKISATRVWLRVGEIERDRLDKERDVESQGKERGKQGERREERVENLGERG